MKNSAIIIALILFTSIHTPGVCAGQSTFDNYYEFGRRSSQSLVEEEDLSDEFDYSKYNVKFSQDLEKRTSYYVKYQYYNKRFDSLENLSNNYSAAGLGLDTVLYSKEDIRIKTGPDLEFKEKFYNNSPRSNYDQIRFDIPLIFKKEGDWAVKVGGGMNSYHYPNAPKDQLKSNARIDVAKKFFGEKLEVSAYYRFQYVSRQKIADRSERICGVSSDIGLDWPVIKGLEAGLEEGMNNTIVYEEREDSYDYKYFDWFAKTKYSLLEKVKGVLKYSGSTRDYADFNHNYDGFAVENGLDARIFKIKDTAFDLKLTYLHKQFRYPYVSSPYSFHNNAIYTDAELAKKDDWKALLGYDTRFYNYPADNTRDKIYYVVRLGIEKHLFKKSLAAGFEYKYTFKNYLHKYDITENLFRLRATAKF